MLNKSKTISSNIFDPFHKRRANLFAVLLTYCLGCFPCVGYVFLVRAGSVLMNHCLFLCLCLFLV